MARKSKKMTTGNHILTQPQDLTPRKRPAAAVRPAKKVTAATTQTESELLAHRSPELRTLLYVILGYSELMTEGEFGSLTDEQGQILERIRQNALELYGLITEMSDHAGREMPARKQTGAGKEAGRR